VTIKAFSVNNRKREFVLDTARGTFVYPFAKADPIPTREDPIVRVFIDVAELGGDGVTYFLRSGAEGSVLADMAYDYNSEPSYIRDALLYRLTIQAQTALAESKLARREVIRRLGTSASQFYRLIDEANYDKTIDSVVALLHVLGREVDLVVRPRSA
jgi:predicted XRE-type DNA-binding protein